MRPTTGKEHDRSPAAVPDDVESTDKVETTDEVDSTDEVPIVRPQQGDHDVIASSELGDQIAAERKERADEVPAGDEDRDEDPTVTITPAADAEPAGVEDADAAGVGEAEVVDAEVAGEPEPVTPDAQTPGAQPEGTQWGGLTPLEPDDLAALDPATLEADLQDEDEGEVVELVEPDGRAPASQRTAADLTASSVLRMSTRPPRAGWRRLIYEVTGGLIRPRLSRSERERAEQLGLIRTLVTQPRRITVLSRKGGVGKTTTTLMLGQTLASERGDRIVAVDGNPDAGSLGYRVAPQPPDQTITDLLNEFDAIQRYADMRRFTAQTDAGLEVLMSDDDPQITTALGDQEYEAVLSLLDRFYNLILIDTGTGILDSAVQGILDGTDQIVLVVAPSLDAARAASQTLDWLGEHGFVELVETAVTVINQTRRSTLVDLSRIEEHFWDRCGATVRVPWDRYLEAGAETELSDLRPATREAYMQLAAAVARRFET